MSQTTGDVLIIGGGIVGMACAYELSSRGARVTVIDKGEIGMGCSYGNAGWITPCFAMPLPMPGMFLKAMGWLMDPDSPLYIKPSFDPLLARWLFRFLWSMNSPQMLRSVKALTEISTFSVEAYEKLDQKFQGSFGFEKKGLLMVSQTEGGVNAAMQEMELVAQHGIPGQLLNPDEIRKLEPALTGPLLGGVYFPSEAHAEPLALVRALAEGAQKNGAQILPRTEVFDFDIRDDGKIQSVRTTRGWLKADQYVLATGSWSTSMAKRLKLRVPVLGGKGYALIVKPFAPAPKIPIMLVERKIAVTPRKDSVRLAGTLELVNQDDSITPRRVNAISQGAGMFMSLPENPEITEVWRGLRPCTPDGVPLIGRTRRYQNLTLCTGHQMLGVQSAPGSARLAADIVLGSTPSFDPYPFRADRF